jgi:hypothetical protein
VRILPFVRRTSGIQSSKILLYFDQFRVPRSFLLSEIRAESLFGTSFLLMHSSYNGSEALTLKIVYKFVIDPLD